MDSVLYLECFAGAAGDMLLATLLDLGWEPQRLRTLPNRLGLADVSIDVERVHRGAIEAPLVRIAAGDDQPHRHWGDIDGLLANADLPPAVIANARLVFRRLAEAEGKVHGHSPHDVHFHEVGAIDAIIDIVGFCLGIHDLGAPRIVASPLPLGRGQTMSAHGIIPLPAPATVALLGDAPVYAFPLAVETVTPTGAALLSTLAASFGEMPKMVLEKVGYGAGTRHDPDGPPNVVRGLWGRAADLPETAETTYLIEANLDDMNPEYYEPLNAALADAGALDVTLVPCIMKRGRPGVLLKVVSPAGALTPTIEAVFRHSTTLGLRYHPTNRAVCERRMTTVETSFGPVRIKHAYYAGRWVGAKPEYADLAASGRPIAEALAEVWRKIEKD